MEMQDDLEFYIINDKKDLMLPHIQLIECAYLLHKDTTQFE